MQPIPFLAWLEPIRINILISISNNIKFKYSLNNDELNSNSLVSDI